MNHKHTWKVPYVTGQINIHSFTVESNGDNTPLMSVHAKESFSDDFFVMIFRPEQAIALAKLLVDHAVEQQEFCVNLFWDEVHADA